MEQYNVLVSEEAKENLMGFVTYIENVFQNQIAAERQFEKINEAINSLSQFPKRIKLNAPDLNNSKGLRYLTVGKQSIIFQVLENQTVWIDAVWNSGRDISKKLRMIEESELFVDSYDKLTSNEVNFEKILHELGTKENKTEYEKGQEKALKLLEQRSQKTSQKTTKKQTRKH